jgi:hypothetical protein
MFGHKKVEVTEDGRNLHDKELKDLYSSRNSNQVIISRQVSWMGHVVYMEKNIEF